MKDNKLENIFGFAINNNEFYRDLYSPYVVKKEKFDDLFFELPIVKKAMLQEYCEKTLSIPYKYYPKSKDVTIIRSSGSTGQYLKIYWDRKDITRSLFPSWAWRKKYYDITPKDKYISFHTVRHFNNKFIEKIPPIDIINERHTSFSKLDLCEERIKIYFEYMESFQPVWIHTQPSIMSLLLEYVYSGSYNLPSSVKYIESTGEYLDNTIKNKLQNDLNVKIANNYGCTEANYIACECPYGHMHILKDNVLVEILDVEGNRVKDGVFGTIVISSKNNHAMPLIRYDTGDVGRILDVSDCPCGCRSPILELKGVRNSRLIKCGDQKLSSYILLYALEKTNEQFNNPIIQYKITQVSITDMNVQFVLGTEFMEWKDAIKDHFLKNIPNDELLKCNWNIEFVSHIYPSSTTGKLQFFESLV